MRYATPMEKRTVGTRIRRARLAMGLSQPELAELVGVKRLSIGQWERDARLPSTELLMKLVEALGVRLAWVMTGKGNGPPRAKVIAREWPKRRLQEVVR